MFKSITVNPSVTFTVPSGLVFRVTGNVNIQGTIKVATCAEDTGETANQGVSRVAASSLPGTKGIGLHPLQARIVKIPLCGGGAGRCYYYGSVGSAGGGSFAIYAQGTITMTSGGRIEANGGSNIVSYNVNGVAGGGGGAGGTFQP